MTPPFGLYVLIYKEVSSGVQNYRNRNVFVQASPQNFMDYKDYKHSQNAQVKRIPWTNHHTAIIIYTQIQLIWTSHEAPLSPARSHAWWEWLVAPEDPVDHSDYHRWTTSRTGQCKEHRYAITLMREDDSSIKMPLLLTHVNYIYALSKWVIL